MTPWSPTCDAPRRAPRGARLASVALACGLAAAAAGCDDDPAGAGGGAPPPALCDGTVAVTVVASGDLPTFAWSPPCGVSDLVVTREANGATAEIAWHVRFPELRPAGPSVRYAQLPPRGETVSAPLPLARGTTYRVTVRSIVGGDAIVGGGSATFVF